MISAYNSISDLNKNISILELPRERWHNFKQGKGLYKLSNFMRVKSFQRGKEKILKLGLTKDKYVRFQMWIDGKKLVLRLHRVVGEVFKRNPRKLPEMNHKDGNKLNNWPRNLEYCTRSHNIKHAFDMGLKSLKGTKNGRAKLTDVQVLEILQSNKSVSLICKKYGIRRAMVSDIKTGSAWNHITGLPKKERK